MRVLVVEDHPALGRALVHGLTAEGFAVDLAVDGEEGLLRAADTSYDVVVLDIMLPRLNGYDVCRRLRAAENWTPVLMLTAKDGEYDEADGLDIGADDYLTKPFSYVVLTARLNALMRRGGRPRPAVLRVGDLRLDPGDRTCRRGTVPVELTTREFSLLECLVRRPGEVLSKQDILTHVWTDHFDLDPNVVEVYIGYLRRKIDEPFGRRTIQTVRGAGYRLADDR
ncbi:MULTISPECIES: response regulator transcription factor [Streptomyces]|uniref:Response regulator transcription factor n=1 Tax=Streptomyces lonegramiae TaxID=3075524 RepID=A0ABU2XIZ7_9ACTN|nr:response regulator transcription factor [Streptomyces sp. DSM 41529]MDT0545065.1 response regulator transcription factor [Streptomyces sp. DSM 41529]